MTLGYSGSGGEISCAAANTDRVPKNKSHSFSTVHLGSKSL